MSKGQPETPDCFEDFVFFRILCTFLPLDNKMKGSGEKLSWLSGRLISWIFLVCQRICRVCFTSSFNARVPNVLNMKSQVTLNRTLHDTKRNRKTLGRLRQDTEIGEMVGMLYRLNFCTSSNCMGTFLHPR